MRVIFLALVLTSVGACSPPNRTFGRTSFPNMQSMTCTMKMVHNGVLNPTYYANRSSDGLTLTIRDLDPSAGTATVAGNNGSERVQYRSAPSQMQFIETTMTGNLTATTVFAPPGIGQPMPVVHSRHIELAPANISISQFAGECVAG